VGVRRGKEGRGKSFLFFRGKEENKRTKRKKIKKNYEELLRQRKRVQSRREEPFHRRNKGAGGSPGTRNWTLLKGSTGGPKVKAEIAEKRKKSKRRKVVTGRLEKEKLANIFREGGKGVPKKLCNTMKTGKGGGGEYREKNGEWEKKAVFSRRETGRGKRIRKHPCTRTCKGKGGGYGSRGRIAKTDRKKFGLIKGGPED